MAIFPPFENFLRRSEMKTIYFRLFAIIVAVIFFATPFCVAQVQYVVTDLGTLGGTSSSAYGINNSGQVVGGATTSSSDTYYPYHAFLWQNGSGMQDLGALGGSFSSSCAYGINDRGEVVGSGFFSTSHAFLYSGGVMSDLNTLFTVGSGSSAYGINKFGEVVGRSYLWTGNNCYSQAFLYSGGVIERWNKYLYTGFYNESKAHGINDRGEVVGCLPTTYTYLAVLCSGGVMSCIGQGVAYGINNSGQVVGTTGTSGHAFLYSGNGPMQDLGTLGGVYMYSSASGINNSGQVVGYAYTSGDTKRAFLYSGSGPMQDLNTLIAPSSGWTLGTANAINDRGQIVGAGKNPAGKTHAFLLTPVGKCQAYQVQAPMCTPIQRLAKWDGINWVPVMPGDLSSGNIHVLVHGWGPGLRTFADDGGKIWNANDPKTGNDTNKDLAGILKNSAIAIKSVAPGDIVVAFNWLDMSATVRSSSDPLSLTEARQSRLKTDEATGDLVNALKSAGISAGVFNGKLQIIGISHGARVSALATENLYKNGKSGSIIVDQLTLADSPEGVTGIVGANNQLADVLGGIKVGRDASSTFVDNYYSHFGESYFTDDDDVVNVRLNPKPSLSIGDKHIYPINWYEGASKNTTTLGLAWSPLEGDIYKNLSSNYEQDWQNPDGSFDDSREYTLRDKDAGLSPVEKWLHLDMSTLLTQGLVTAIPSGMHLTEHSPAYWHSSFVKSIDDMAIEFTYQFLNAGDGDQLTVWIDDQMRFVITGSLAGIDAYTTDIDISDLGAGYHILSVALNNYGDINASVDVTNFTMVSVPEPSSLLLLCVIVMTVLSRRKSVRA